MYSFVKDDMNYSEEEILSSLPDSRYPTFYFEEEKKVVEVVSESELLLDSEHGNMLRLDIINLHTPEMPVEQVEWLVEQGVVVDYRIANLAKRYYVSMVDMPEFKE